MIFHDGTVPRLLMGIKFGHKCIYRSQTLEFIRTSCLLVRALQFANGMEDHNIDQNGCYPFQSGVFVSGGKMSLGPIGALWEYGIWLAERGIARLVDEKPPK